MGKLTLILGGARSGKSDYGLKMALEGAYRQVLFVATAQALFMVAGLPLTLK